MLSKQTSGRALLSIKTASHIQFTIKKMHYIQHGNIEWHTTTTIMTPTQSILTMTFYNTSTQKVEARLRPQSSQFSDLFMLITGMFLTQTITTTQLFTAAIMYSLVIIEKSRFYQELQEFQVNTWDTLKILSSLKLDKLLRNLFHIEKTDFKTSTKEDGAIMHLIKIHFTEEKPSLKLETETDTD